MQYAGDYDMTDTVYIPLNAFTSDDPSASATITDLADGDIHIHKDGSTTQRSSGSGVTVAINFDGLTGNTLVSIDLTDNTDAGYYATGSTYLVRMEGVTIDAATINAWIGLFTIGKVRAAVRTELGLAGSSLTAIPWNAAWDAEVESEVQDVVGLAGSSLTAVVWNAAWDAEVESEVIDGIAAGTALTSIPWNSAWDAEVQSEVVDALTAEGYSSTRAAYLDELAAANLPTDVDAILVDTGTTLQAEVDAIQAAVITNAAGVDIAADIIAIKAETAAIVNDTDVIDDATSGLVKIAQDVAAILVDTATLPEGIAKNVALPNFEFLMVDATDHFTPETGLTVAGNRSIDGGAFAGVTGAIAEVGNGIYQFDAAQADTNGDFITWRFSSAGAADTFVSFKTE